MEFPLYPTMKPEQLLGFLFLGNTDKENSF